MKALVVEAPGQLAFREIAEPHLGPYDALVQIEVCGICNSTDRKLIEGALPWAPSPPFVLGHESVGRVLEVGALVRKFRIGDRVTRAQSHWAGEIPNLGVCIGGFAERGTVRDVEAMVAAGDTSLADNWAAARRCAGGDTGTTHHTARTRQARGRAGHRPDGGPSHVWPKRTNAKLSARTSRPF